MTKTDRSRRRSQQGRGAQQSAGKESDFARFDWTGQAACDQFFRLHEQPQFRGTGVNGVVLPPHGLSVSRRPMAGISVAEAYAHGLSYAEQVFGAGGFMLFFFVCLAPLMTLIYWSEGLDLDVFDCVMLTLGVCMLWFMFRFDTSGYRSAPVMFNRATGQVHVFTDETKFWRLKPLWGGDRCSVQTYDWGDVRGQVSRFRVFTGNMAQDNAALSCLVLTSQGGEPQIVAEFSLGITTSALAIQLLLDHWEHIRRYMEHEGPMFQEGEGPYEQATTKSLLGAIFFGQPFIGPGWREQYENADLLTMIWQGVSPFFFPVTMLLGLCRWASYHLRSKPKWPAEVLASVGGAPLKGRELDAWRSAIPEHAKTAQALDIGTADRHG